MPALKPVHLLTISLIAALSCFFGKATGQPAVCEAQTKLSPLEAQSESTALERAIRKSQRANPRLKSGKKRFVTARGRNIRFNLKNAAHVGLRRRIAQSATISSGGRARSGSLVKLDAFEVASRVMRNGNFSIQHMEVGTNGKIYLWPSGVVAVGAVDNCGLIEVNPDGPVLRCIEAYNGPAFEFQYWEGKKALQFDDQGRIYYIVLDGVHDGYCGTENRYVLKRHNGIASQVMFVSCTPQTYINDWAVSGDGTIVAAGEHWEPIIPDYQFYVMRYLFSISSEGVVTNLTEMEAANSRVPFVRLFPDEEIYVGTATMGEAIPLGVTKYVAQDHALSPNYWINSGTYSEFPAQYGTDALCTEEVSNEYPNFCSSAGSAASPFYATSGGSLFALIADELVQYYPSVSFPVTQVKSIGRIVGTQDKLVLSGVLADDEFGTPENEMRSGLVLHDAVSHEETVLMQDVGTVGILETSVPRPGVVRVFGLYHVSGEFFVARINVATGELDSTPVATELDEVQSIQ